jgi:hypothetical protein
MERTNRSRFLQHIDLRVRAAQWPQWICRFAGRMETGQDSITDPDA